MYLFLQECSPSSIIYSHVMTNIHPFSEFLESLRIGNNSQKKFLIDTKRAAKSSFEKV